MQYALRAAPVIIGGTYIPDLVGTPHSSEASPNPKPIPNPERGGVVVWWCGTVSKVPEFADFWEGRQQHRKKRLEQKGGGSPNSNDSPETVLAKQRANRGAGASGKGPKPATDYDNVAFPSLLQKGIAMSSKQLGSGDYGAVYEVRFY